MAKSVTVVETVVRPGAPGDGGRRVRALSRCVARAAVYAEMHRGRGAVWHACVVPLDAAVSVAVLSGTVRSCARDEILVMLKERKLFPPGYRAACFSASAARFGPLL